MVLKGFSWRRVLAETEEEEEEDAQQILESGCGWDIFTEEILPRLPADRLQTLKPVCKNWNRIISSPYFVDLHLNRFNQSRIRVLVAKNYGDRRKPEIIEYKINSSGIENKQIKIPYPPEIEIRPIANSAATILGSCDGLICFYWKGIGICPTIAIFNPSTGKCLSVKSRLKDNYKINCSWFGHHPCSGEYVLVLGDFDRGVGVYKFDNRSSNCLKKIHSTYFPAGLYFYYQERVGTLLHGALHWPAQRDTRHVISAYHLDNNKYFEISPPFERDFGLFDFKLGVVEGCLFAFFMADDDDDDDVVAGVFEMWIMKEYGVQQSWTKYANIEGFKNRTLSPLAFFPNGNDLILYPNSLGFIKYPFDGNKALLLHDYLCPYKAIICVDSLVSPEIVWNM